LTPNKLFVLDFDGVICDSNLEVYTTSFLAFIDLMQIDIEDKSVTQGKIFYNLFLKYRDLGRFPPDFLNLWLTALKEVEEDFKQNTDLSERLKSKYRNLYFSKRDYLKSEGLKNWLSLHVFYDGMEDFISELFFNDMLYIASAKDETSISQILEDKGIDFDEKYILGSENYSDKDEMFIKIKEDKKSYSIIFIDDNLVNLKKALNHGFECYFAKWGYGDRYMINQSNIYQIDLANISQLLPTKL